MSDVTRTADVGRGGGGEEDRLVDRALAEELVDRAREQGVQLLGENGLLRAMTKAVLERGLAEELTEHLGYEPHERAGSANARNGSTPKRLHTEAGTVELDVPRDRDGSFEPRLVRKGQRRLDGIDKIVIGLYARGMTVRDIRAHLAEIYDVEVSPDLISRITDAVLEEVRDWQARPLERVYPVIFLDAIVCKVRSEGTVRNKAAHLAVGVDVEGRKEVLGIWVEATEGRQVLATGDERPQGPRRRGRPGRGLRRADRPAGGRRGGLAGRAGADLITSHCPVARWSRRSPRHRERTYADACLRGPHADPSLPVEAGCVVASGSRASSAVMRFQGGPASR
jgi:Transposase, Mutator family